MFKKMNNGVLGFVLTATKKLTGLPIVTCPDLLCKFLRRRICYTLDETSEIITFKISKYIGIQNRKMKRSRDVRSVKYCEKELSCGPN